jgi:hypothetical protein
MTRLTRAQNLSRAKIFCIETRSAYFPCSETFHFRDCAAKAGKCRQEPIVLNAGRKVSTGLECCHILTLPPSGGSWLVVGIPMMGWIHSLRLYRR